MTARAMDELKRNLAALRRGARRLYALDGLSRLLLIGAAACAVTFVLDWSVYHLLNEELPRGVRLFLLGCGVTALAWAFARYLVYPLRRPMSDDDLALCVERAFPALEDRLISSVQLARVVDDPAWRSFSSPELVDHLIAEAGETSARLNFRKVLVPRRVRRIALLASAVAVAGIFLVAIQPLYASIWFQRLLGGAIKWPRQTFLMVVDPPRYVAKGDDCWITVRAGGRIPDRATIHYRFVGGEAGIARMEGTPVTPGPGGDFREFKYAFSRVVEAFAFSVRAGDDETEWHRVEVRPAPALERLVKWYRYPRYLPLKDTPADAPEEGGHVKAPAGTEVRLRAVVTEPLAAARLVYASRPDKPEPLAVESDPQHPKRLLAGALRVRANDEYRIELDAENGLRNREPIRYSILAVPDAPPTLRVIEPGADRIATPDAVWPLQIEASDDYGIKSIRMVWWVIAQGPGPEQAVDFTYPAQNDAEYGATRIGSRFPFDLSKTGAREREQVAYRFEAWDFDETKTRPTQTRTYHFTLWSRSDLEKREEETMSRLKEELRRILESEEKIRGQAAILRDRLKATESLDPAQKAEFHTVALDQRQKVGQRLERVVRDLQESIKTVRHNKLLDQTALDKLERLRTLLGEVLQSKSPEASHAIAEAGSARTPSDRGARLSRALERVDSILADLREAIALLEDWMTYQDIVRRWREVKERQDHVYKAIVEMLHRRGGPQKKQ
jgi:hypothetical protein